MIPISSQNISFPDTLTFNSPESQPNFINSSRIHYALQHGGDAFLSFVSEEISSGLIAEIMEEAELKGYQDVKKFLIQLIASRSVNSSRIHSALQYGGNAFLCFVTKEMSNEKIAEIMIEAKSKGHQDVKEFLIQLMANRTDNID